MKKSNEIKVNFQPCDQTVYVLPGTLLIEAAERAGILIENPCGGKGTCGKCKVKVVSGQTSSPATSTLSAEDVAAGYCLSCQTQVATDAVVEVPHESLVSSLEQILTGGGPEKLQTQSAIVKKRFKLQPPSREDFSSDSARLRSALDDAAIPYRLLKTLPKFLRDNDWEGTAVLSEGNLVALERGDTAKELYGVAVDIGTTTMVGSLFNLAGGEELGVSSAMNPQVKFGADVITRINCIREDPRALIELQQAAMNAVNGIVASLAEKIGANAQHIYQVVLAGNSTMQQIFLGIDPSALGELPFVQAFGDAQFVEAREIGLEIYPYANVMVFPQIGGFVGGDTVAAMATTRIDECDQPTLLIDIGTNGEIVLAHNGLLLATSTAAGPALEGAKIEHGMRAAAGAIEKIAFEGDDLVVNVIGNVSPVGLCGTALIDVVAEMLRNGLLSREGRILARSEVDQTVPDSLRTRLFETKRGNAFIITKTEESGLGKPICLYQQDVSEMQLAVGAIRAGINLLLKQRNLTPEDLNEVLLAGAFGNYIRKANALRIGLLPQTSCENIRFIGNAALHGAKKCLLMKTERTYVDDLSRRTEHVDLSMKPEFQDAFAEAMLFPGENIAAYEQ